MRALLSSGIEGMGERAEMVKILVIPDVHLRGWMFEEADRLMRENGIEQAVCLGDLVDDWDMQMNREAYKSVFEKAFEFDEKHPNTLWCYGNHDVSYIWHQLESGYSPYQEELVEKMMSQMQKKMGERLNFCHVIGKCLFTHAGVTWQFLDALRYRGFKIRGIRSIEDVKNIINQCGEAELWKDESPVWARPSHEKDYRVFSEYGVFQVTGHTPIGTIFVREKDNIMFCDNFSILSNGKIIGQREFPVVTDEGMWVGSLKAVVE